jgi:hypothetical protein
MYPPATPPRPPELPPEALRQPACGHTRDDYVPELIHPARMPLAWDDGHSRHVRRISAGDRELRQVRCPDCHQSTGYLYRHLDDGEEEFIGGDPQVVQAALFALLDQPAAGIFAIDLVQTRHVVPRHHLPSFDVRPH